MRRGGGCGRRCGMRWNVTNPIVKITWLRFDEVECIRCKRVAGDTDDTCWVVEGEGIVCDRCITPAEDARAERG